MFSRVEKLVMTDRKDAESQHHRWNRLDADTSSFGAGESRSGVGRQSDDAGMAA